MEQLQQMTRTQEPQVWQGLRRSAQEGLGGDAFLAVFQHMMEGLADGEGDLLTPEGGQPELEPGKDQNALAMMGELAGMGLMPAPVQTRQAAENAALLGAAAIGPQAGRTRETAPVQAAEAPAMDAGTAQSPAARQELPEVPVAEAGCTERPASDGGAEYRAEGAFRTAVEEARRQLDAPEEPGKKTAAAGAEAAAQTEFSPRTETAAPARAERSEEAPPLARQLDKGISEQLELGKKEFTLKLRPASLGEITVRLVERGGKTTLSIVTASAETAKTINSDLAALREAVRPMAVEVHEAVPRAPENAQSQPFGMMGEQQFQQFQQQQQRQSFHRAPQTGFAPRSETAEAEQRFRAPLLAAGLDTYV